MIAVKIQCGCGQKYAFDVEPLNGRMPKPVACPICGADGTAAANDIISQSIAAHPPAPSPPAAAIRVTTPPPTARGHAPPFPAAPTSPVHSSKAATLLWYEQVWVALPIALVAVGGAIGGGCGGAAWAINRTVFQKTQNPALRYVWTGLISLTAVVLWLGTATFILALLHRATGR